MKKVDNSDLYKKTPKQISSDKKLEFERYWINWFDYINTVNPLGSYILPQVVYDLQDVGLNPKYNRTTRNKYMDELMGRLDCKMLFSGTNRRTYYCLYDPRVVLKVPISPTGIHNNLDEIYPQHILKPFCSKIYEVDPTGTIQLSERLIPIIKLDEKYLPEIYMLLTKKIQRDGILMDDIGVRSFKNYGIRSGFGVCLLDFPTVYISDRNLSRCNVCGGHISYDKFFNRIECSKCHMRYKPQDIAIKGNPIDIFKIHNMSKLLKIDKFDQDENTRRTSKMKIQFIDNGKVVSSNHGSGYVSNAIRPKNTKTQPAKPQIDIQAIANSILNNLKNVDLNAFKERILEEAPDEENIAIELAKVLVKNTVSNRHDLDKEQIDIIVESVAKSISTVIDRDKDINDNDDDEEEYDEKDLKGEKFDPNDPANAMAIDMWKQMQKHAYSGKTEPVKSVQLEPSKEGLFDKNEEEEPITNPDFFDNDDNTTTLEYSEGEAQEEELVSNKVDEVPAETIRRVPAFNKVEEEDVPKIKKQIDEEFGIDKETKEDNSFKSKLLNLTTKINTVGFEPFDKIDIDDKYIKNLDLDNIETLYDDIMSCKVDDLVKYYLLDDEDYTLVWGVNKTLKVSEYIHNETFQKKMYHAVKDNKIKFTTMVIHPKFLFNLYGPYLTVDCCHDDVKYNKFNTLAGILIGFLPFRSNDINISLHNPSYDAFTEVFRNIEANNPNAYTVLKQIIFYYHVINQITYNTITILDEDDPVISKSKMISDYYSNLYLFGKTDNKSKVYTDFGTSIIDMSVFSNAMEQIKLVLSNIGQYIFNCSDIDSQTANLYHLNIAEAIKYSKASLLTTYIKNDVDLIVEDETARLFTYSYPLVESSPILHNILENTNVCDVKGYISEKFEGDNDESSESNKHHCECGNCGCGHCK